MNLLSDLKDISKILSSKERRQLYKAAWMQVFSGLIDMIGVVSVLPFLSVAAKPALLDSNVYLRQLKDWSQLEPDKFLFFARLVFLYGTVIKSAGKNCWYMVFAVCQSKDLDGFAFPHVCLLPEPALSLPPQTFRQCPSGKATDACCRCS